MSTDIGEKNELCPCGFGTPYASCCGPLHAGTPAPTAAQLMRSRYAAFALNLEGYLLDTWAPATRPEALELDADMTWLKLIIEGAEHGGPFDSEGTVTFSAIGRDAHGRFEQRERSRFVRSGSRWLYLDGTTLS